MTEQERVEVAAGLAAAGASFEHCFLAFRRTGCGYIDSLAAVRRVYPGVTLFEARTFFETRFPLVVLEISVPIVTALRLSIATPPEEGASRRAIAFLRRALSPLAIAAHFEAALGVAWRPVYESARLMDPADDASAAVTRDLLEEHGLDWEAELAAITARV